MDTSGGMMMMMMMMLLLVVLASSLVQSRCPGVIVAVRSQRGLRQHHKVYGPRRRYRRVVVGRDEGYSKPSPPQVSIEEARAALIAKFAEEEVGYFYFKDDLGLDDGRLAAITAHGAVLQQRRETLRRKGEWARKALGLEHSQLAALVSLQPTVLGVTSETLRRKIEVLSSYDSRDLGGAVSRAPSLLTRSVAALWRVRRGLGPCAALFDRCPAIAGSERAVFNAKLLPYRVVEAVPEALLASSLEKRLATLGAHGVDVLRWPRCVLYDVDAKLAELGAIAHEEVGGLPLSALVRAQPALLSIGAVNFRSHLRFFREVCGDDAAAAISRRPSALGLSIDGNLRPTVAFLEARLGPVASRNVTKKFPAVFGLSIENNLRIKFEVLDAYAPSEEDTNAAVLACPSILGYSTHNRLRPRLETLEARGLPFHAITKFITLPEPQFQTRLRALRVR